MKNLKVAWDGINALVDEVKDFVKANGGFIKTANENGDCDNIYAYVVDWDADDVHEDIVYAVKVEDDELWVATCGKTWITIAESADDVDENDWYVVGSSGDMVLTAPTILSIADSIEQFVE